ncbi:hypothetical protein PTKIN_Ptkin03bG0204500 [Pterospermum kingtungense]
MAECKKSKIGEGSGVGQDIEDGKDEHCLGSSDRGTYETDSDGNVRVKKRGKIYFDPTDPVPSFALGMIFQGLKQFKDALTKYAIAKRFDFHFIRNEKSRTRASCKKKGCPFVIYAEVDNSDGFFKIKTLQE